MRHLGFGICDLGLLLAFAASAVAADVESLRQKQQAQEKARAMAGELVSAVLDLQLRQLEENGLAGLPLYRDVAGMKQGISRLVEQDMGEVVELLIAAQHAPPAEQPARLSAARSRVREVVAQLMAERQRLARRMQIARLAADARQLIDLQARVHQETRSLPEHKPDERERLTLATIDDQADVQRLYYQLVAALEDVSTWGGKPAEGAADGLRILKAAQVEPELKQAAAALSNAQLPAAEASQRNVLRGLAALLDRLENVQGLGDGDREAALRLVRELLARQQQLRDAAKKAPLTAAAIEPLIEQQTAIQKELSRLAPALSPFPATEPLVEEAKAASFAATARLFEEQQTAAIEQQTRVIGNLAQIEKVLEQGLDLTQSDKSADELAAEAARLAELKEQLAAVSRQQEQVVQQAPAKPPAAAEAETEVGQRLAAIEDDKYTSAIDFAIDTAKEKVVEATLRLKDAAAKAKGPSDVLQSAQTAADEALTAIRQAQAEVESQLADTLRRQKAVEVGELARAAEAIERAAAAERETGRQAAELATTDELDALRAKELAGEQAIVAEVAERIAAGVKNTAPKASRQLQGIEPSVQESENDLLSASNQAPSSQTPAAAKAAAERASQLAAKAAEQLLKAAAELRKQQGRAARQLTQLADGQLGQVAAARQAVEAASEAAEQTEAAKIARLQEARQKTREARRDQLLAEGKTDQAAARGLLDQIDQLRSEQQAADSAAAEIARGKANSPLEAANTQQQVADHSSDLAGQSQSAVARPLRQAQQAAASAAKETLSGSPTKADASRREVHQALEAAAKAAREAARQAEQSPAGRPDANAQARAAQSAEQAAKLADSAAAESSETAKQASRLLREAQQQAAAAAQQLAANEPGQAQPQQRAAEQSLAQAAGKLDEALEKLAAKEREQLAQATKDAGDLSQRAGQAEPGAAAALAQARRAAERGAGASANDEQSHGRSSAGQASQQYSEKLNQAAAALAAREQLLRRDRNLAETLAELAHDQQQARDAIRQAAEELEQLARRTPQQSNTSQKGNSDASNASSSEPPTEQQIAAAQTLQEAQQQFTAAQMATGEGAAEVSGQQQVANQPIREGLEMASRLDPFRVARAPDGEEPGDKGQEPGDSSQQPADGAKPDANAANPQSPNPKSQIPNPKSPPGAKTPQLGTGMVPASPEATAQQIAGPQAQAAAKSAMAAAGQGQGESGQGNSETPKEGSASATATKGGAVKKGQSSPNQSPEKGELQTAQAADADSRGELGEGTAINPGSGKVESEAWFAKLPPSLQSAIQAKSRAQAPRGYEQRLRRYFESVD